MEPEIHLHIGAHKTATTYFQRIFQDNRKLLAAQGWCIPHHRKTRKFLTYPCQLKAYERLGQNWKTRYSDEELRDIIGSFFDTAVPADTRHILLTDENFIGHPGHVVRSGILYSRKKIFSEVLREFLPREPRRIMLCIREYVGFFTSVYCQYLADTTEEAMVMPEVFAENIGKRWPNWHNCAKTVKTAFPNTEMEIWSFDESKSDLVKSLPYFVGPEVAAHLKEKTSRKNVERPTMSQGALDRFLVIAADKGAAFALEALKDIRQEYDGAPDARRANIFSPEQVAALNERSEKHFSEIRKDHKNFTWLGADLRQMSTSNSE